MVRRSFIADCNRCWSGRIPSLFRGHLRMGRGDSASAWRSRQLVALHRCSTILPGIHHDLAFRPLAAFDFTRDRRTAVPLEPDGNFSFWNSFGRDTSPVSHGKPCSNGVAASVDPGRSKPRRSCFVRGDPLRATQEDAGCQRDPVGPMRCLPEQCRLLPRYVRALRTAIGLVRHDGGRLALRATGALDLYRQLPHSAFNNKAGYFDSLRVTVRPLTGLPLASRKRAQKSVAPPAFTTAARTTLAPFFSVIRFDTPSSITVCRSL